MIDFLEFIDAQLASWPQALERYRDLGRTERRSMRIGDMTVGIQHNPARIISTAAKTDDKSLSERACFLCRENRPAEQEAYEIAAGWELLVNPYPIFPTHFTIVSRGHKPQEGWQPDMCEIAEKMPGHTVFFNGRQAGASCPDHLHLQAVKTDELPLMRLIEERHEQSKGCVASRGSLGIDLPFDFTSHIVTPDAEGFRLLMGMEETLGREYLASGQINIYVWIGRDGVLRVAGVPRKAHRPSCYGPGEGQRLISPGCIDMAGVIITPLAKDYEGVGEGEVREIYAECGRQDG